MSAILVNWGAGDDGVFVMPGWIGHPVKKLPGEAEYKTLDPESSSG